MSEKNISTIIELLNEYRVEIPIVQRDYAQGRKDEHAKNVRINLLKDIKNTVLEERGPLDLSFVYGKEENGKFIPVDGQQRLTTLFLLHLYAFRNDEEKSEILHKFTYETRESSGKFFYRLVDNRSEVFGFHSKPSLIIKDTEWFLSSWINDPTIQSVLVVLDDIQEMFNEVEDLADKLTNLDCVQVTFYSYEPFGHNNLVGANMYDRTLSGIRNALNANLNVSINTPLCTINKDYVKTLKFLKELGIQYVTCSGLIVTGNAKLEASRSTQLYEDELYEVLKEAAKFCAKNDMELAFTSPGWLSQERIKELGLTVPMCGACLSNMAIAPDGSVVPCQSWLSDDSLGNMLNDSWDEIWNSEVCKKIRDESAKCNYSCPLLNK